MRSLFPQFDSFFLSDPFFSTQLRLTNNPERNLSTTNGEHQSFIPSTDLSETEKEIKIVCNVPGMQKENLKIDLDEEHHTLTVSGNIEKEKEEDNEKFHSVERSFGSFSRCVKLPRNVNLEDIKANMENGVLRVSIPKVPDQPKKIRSVNIE